MATALTIVGMLSVVACGLSAKDGLPAGGLIFGLIAFFCGVAAGSL